MTTNRNRRLGPGLVGVMALIGIQALATPASGQTVRIGTEGVTEGAIVDAPARADAAGPRRPWATQDPADGLYRQGRDALNRNEYRRAAELFAEIVSEFPGSEYAGDALYWRAFSLYRQGGARNLGTAVRQLERQGRRYPEAATRVNGDAEALETRIRGALARYGDAESAEYITQRATQEACEEDEVRTAALNALLQMDSDRAVPILVRLMKSGSPCSEELRRHAVFLLSQHETPETRALMVDLARNDPDPEVRRQAVFWLSQMGAPEAIDVLVDVLEGEEDPEMQLEALVALGQLDDDRVRRILSDYARNESKPEEVRGQAIFWLIHQADAMDISILRDLYDSVESAELKQTLFYAVAQRQDEETVDWILERALDESESMEVRQQAIFWAAQAGAPIDRLEGLYESMGDDPEVREQLILVYAQSDDPAAVERLIEIARNETDPELKKHAIFWLGQSNDPRAAEFLLELIEP